MLSILQPWRLVTLACFFYQVALIASSSQLCLPEQRLMLSSASVSAQANRAGCFIKAAHDELSARQQREGRLQLSSCKIVVMG